MVAKLFKDKRVIAVLTLIVLVIAISAYIMLTGNSDVQKGSINLTDYGYQNLSDNKVMTLLNEKADDSNFIIYVNTNINVDKDTMKAELFAQNSEDNKNECILRIVDKDYSEIYYESDIIPPGYNVAEARLFDQLGTGDYPALAIFYILDDNGDTKSQVEVEVTLNVK